MLSLSNSFSFKDFMEGMKFIQSIPPPEKSLESNRNQEKELTELIEKLRSKLSELKEERDEINELISDYSVKLETLEAELEMLNEEKHMLESIVVEDDDSFLDNLPFFCESVKKSADLKLKDVKEVTLLIKKQKRHLEICMNCEKKIKDEKGRKASLKHYHFCDEELSKFKIYENDEFIYEPIICEECVKVSDEDLESSAIVTCSKGETNYGFLVSEKSLKNQDLNIEECYESFVKKLKEIDRIKAIEILIDKRDKLV